MNTQIESVQALGIDIWLPASNPQKAALEFGFLTSLSSQPVLVIASSEDQQNWHAVEELLQGILKWLKVASGSYNVAFLQDKAPHSLSFQELLTQTKPSCILSFGVSLRLLLDSHPGIRYFETLALTHVINNVNNKRQVMNDFAGFSL